MQSDQSIHCPLELTLHPWLSKMRQVNIPVLILTLTVTLTKAQLFKAIANDKLIKCCK